MEHIRFENGVLYALDQRALPVKEDVVPLKTVQEVAEAIRTLLVRGAPLIGVSAAYGMAISARAHAREGAEDFKRALHADARLLASTRPTAVNLFWALKRCEAEIVRTLDETDGDVRAAAAFAETLARWRRRATARRWACCARPRSGAWRSRSTRMRRGRSCRARA